MIRFELECTIICFCTKSRFKWPYFFLFSLKISTADNKECNSDFVKVMDGDCVSRLGESKFCGDEIPSKFESTTNRLCVKFYSDDSQNDKGFSVSYNAISSPTQQIGMLLQSAVIYCTDIISYDENAVRYLVSF